MTCLFCCAHHRRRAPNNKREQQPLPHKPDPKVIRLSEVHNGGTGGAQQAHVFASCFSSVIVVGWPPLFMTFPSLGSRRSKWFYCYCSKRSKRKSHLSRVLSFCAAARDRGKEIQTGSKSMWKQCFGTEVAALVGKEDCSKKRRWEEKERNV